MAKVLDSKTPLGSMFMDEQRVVEDSIRALGYVVVRTGRDDSSHDVSIMKMIGGKLVTVAIAEIKSRISQKGDPLTLDFIKNSDGYFISYSKIEHGSNVSREKGVPFYVIVSLMADNIILSWKVTNDSGEIICDPKIKVVQSRKTVNGGTAYRTNAFLPYRPENVKTIGRINVRGLV